MAEITTPNTGGRGRRIQLVIKLNYATLGNPEDVILPTSGLQAQLRHQKKVDQVPETSKTAKSRSSVSSTARKLELEAKKKIMELKRAVRNKKAELDYQVNSINILKERLTRMDEERKENFVSLPDSFWDERHSKMQLLADTEMKACLLSSELEALKENVQEETSIIEEELEIDKEDLVSQGSHSSEDSQEKMNRIKSWVNTTTPQDVENRRDEIQRDVTFQENHPQDNQQAQQHIVQGATSPQQPALNVADLVTALGQAFPQRQQDNTVVIKNKVDMDLPEFNGNPEDWTAFVDQYRRTTTMYKLSNTDNLYRLRKSLKGPAWNSVKFLFNCPSNVTEVMESLEMEYGRAELIIESMIQKAKSAKSPDIKNPGTMVEFARIVQSLVATIKGHKQEKHYMENAHLLKILVDKLPTYKQEQWFEWFSGNVTREKNLAYFCEWMTLQKRVACEMTTPKTESWTTKTQDGFNRRRGNHRFAGASATEDEACLFCGRSNHRLGKCFQLNKKPVNEKWDFVKEKKLCFCCLEQGHSSNKCPNTTECGKSGCKKNHHPILHRDQLTQGNKRVVERRQVPLEELPVIDDGTAAVAYAYSLPIIPVRIKHKEESVKVHAFLDCGSSFSYIESDLAKKLGLEGDPEVTSVVLFGGKKTNITSARVELSISGDTKNAQSFKVKDVRTIDKLGLPGRTHDFEELKRHYPHLKLMHAKSCSNAIPRVLIGFDNYELFAARKILEDDSNETAPRAYMSKLGWYVSQKMTRNDGYCNMSVLDQQTHDIVKNYFMSESFGVKPLKSARSKEDEKALQLMETITMMKQGRWETGLLWRNEEAQMPESKSQALRRLKVMEGKMDRDAKLAELVVSKFEDYISKGYLKKVERTDNSKRKYYLPWFFAYHVHKKPRLVFDAASKSHGKSFNDFMMKGPDFLGPLPAVLHRFRLHAVALTGDIKEMFHQVVLRKSDQPSQTVLYRGRERNVSPQEYQMTVLFFGSASSPCSAIFCKDKNADRFIEKHPAAVKAIKLDHYMDDFLGSAPSEEEAIQLRKQISKVHESGGFSMCKWNSNSAAVLESIPSELRALEDIQLLEKSDVPYDKTLGMWWSPSSDDFLFKVSLSKVKEDVKTGDRMPTKREVASLVSSLFDPLGFICPLKIVGMRILQEVWRSGVGWDDTIPVSVHGKWKDWLAIIPSLENIRVPRILSPSLHQSEDVQLHIFNDGSDEAYSCCLYIRVKTGGSFDVAFIAGKVRIAPMKGQTIPRMELDAALLGSRMARSVCDAFGEDLKIHRRIFWTDSKTVLCWIRSTSTRFNQYVGSRVGEIQELSEVNEWRWIPTKENAADDATRSAMAEELSADCRWLTGPDFLREAEETWPTEPVHMEVNQEELEVKKIVFLAVPTTHSFLPDITRFSSWLKLVKSTAAVMIVADVLRKRRNPSVTVSDLRIAELVWIQQAQSESFPDEIKALKRGKSIDSNSKLSMLSPSLNGHGIIISNGRIRRAHVGDQTKYPPILCPSHPYTQLLIDWYHRIGLHFGQERILNELRRKYWILHSRTAVRKSRTRCGVCKGRALKPQPPLMGDLPEARLDSGKPVFYNTGIDYFGPYEVKHGRGVVKRWGVLFSCLTTRAVHLELADNLETSEMLNALVRFINLRGCPANIWSDNGTNLVGANNEIKKNLQDLDQKRISDFSTAKGLEWHFIPPASPHMGGSWERMIGCAKRILSSLLNEQHPRETTLRTLFAEVTGILNSRPLTHVSGDPDDDQSITPNDLLHIKSVIGPSVPGEYDGGNQYKKSWRYGQWLAEHFWKRWSLEYLPWLARRTKWNKTVKPLKVGDIVVVLEDNAPRNKWKKGIIMEVYQGRDNQVRSVLVRVTHVDARDPKKPVKVSILRRPVVKVAKLDCGETFVPRVGTKLVLQFKTRDVFLL